MATGKPMPGRKHDKGEPPQGGPRKAGAAGQAAGNGEAARPRKAPPSGLEVVNHRNRTSYHLASLALRTARWSVVSGILGIAIGVAGWVMRPEPVYFAVSESGRITPIQALDTPIRSTTQITNWAGKAVTESISMDFVRFRDQLARAQQYYTPSGFDSFILALKESGNIDSVKTNRYVVDANLNGSPVVVNEGTTAGRYYWRMKIPLIVGYESAEKSRSQTLVALLTVLRRPTTDSRHGVGIQQIVLKPA